MRTNTEIIKEFVQSWSNLDPQELGTYFTEDGCYHNMPFQAVKGRKAVEQFIAGFAESWTETKWEILNIMESGDLVFCERVDRAKTTAGDVELPCVGVFEMKEGKIQEWRDYFDMATYTNALS